MIDILVRPAELRQAAVRLRAGAQKTGCSLITVDETIHSLDGWRFLGNRSTSMQAHYLLKRDALLHVRDVILRFAEDLENVASMFGKADAAKPEMAPETLGASVTLPLQTGVLGVSAVSVRTSPGLARARAEERKLKAEYKSWLEKNQKEINGWTVAMIDNQISDIAKAIQDLKNGIVDIQNPKDLASWLMNVFTTADDEFVASSEDNIAKLEGLLEKYKTRRDLLIEKSNFEARLQDQQELVIEAATNGNVAKENETTTSWLRNQLGGCTQYVAEKRDIAAFGNGHPGNASEWLRQAEKAGYDTGELPVKGAILCYKPGYDPDGAGSIRPIGDAGHVGYVESVTRVDGGYSVKFSHASTIYGDQYAGGWKRGAHTPPITATKFIPDGGLDGISFIYDKS